jgi:putative membrane-bound dehydrogenase-like protein
MKTSSFVVLLSLLAAGCSSHPPSNSGYQGETSRSVTPADALKSFRLSEDFRVELFAAEPDVMDPVDMSFDEDGRAYVLEMRDLPDDPPSGKPARGRVKLLEDVDGDGKADKSVLFAEDLIQSSGLMTWQGGVIACAAPNIWFLKDTNGDGKADVRELWFTGFYNKNPEGHITNPRLGPDNWIYLSNSGNEGSITSPKNPKHPAVQVRGNDFRFDPITFDFEPASGSAQYGATFDDWGNRFISQNTTHLRHVVLPRPYLARSPLLDVGNVWSDPYEGYPRKMYPATPPQEWRVIRTKLRNERFAELKSSRTEILQGYFTGAAGGTMYSGDAWPEQYKGSIFTGDVSGNLVRRDILTPDGVTFKARPAKEGVEFLVSTDQWFRPTNFTNAPDGNLYMMDMQRQVIETPLSIPEELRKSIDFYKGDTLGRVYRIVPNQPRVKRPLRTDFAGKSPAALVGYLEHPNGWHRVTAQRRLLEERDRSVGPALRELASRSQSAQARLLSLYLLRTMKLLDQPTVQAALKDPRPEIRYHAIAMAEEYPALERDVLTLVKDPHPRVQMQLALSLGNFTSAAARGAVVQIAATNIKDRWIRMSALSSAAGAPVEFYQALSARGVEVPKDLLASIGGLVGTRKSPSEIQAFITRLPKRESAEEGLRGLATGLRLVGARQLPGTGIEAALSSHLNAGVDAAWDVARFFELKSLIDRASKEAIAAETPAGKRALAVTALRGAQPAVALPLLARVLDSNPPAEVQTAAVLSLSSFDDPKVGPALLRHWRAYSPEARTKAVGALLAQKSRVPLLLDAIEKQQVELAMIEVGARNRLLESSDRAIVERARKIFQSVGGDRAKVVAKFKDVLDLQGDARAGKTTFDENCARCHLPRKQGGRVGPDLSGINVKSKDELLEAILNPSAAIEPRFVNYLVTTKDGRMYDGVLSSETAGALTLRGGSEEDVTILRANISEIRASTISLMPEDIEKSMKKQDIANVISYLRGGL